MDWIKAGNTRPVYPLNFLSATLDSSLTFTRASNAWYYNSSGVLTQATSNTPRFDYNPTTLALNGLLVEQQSTNLVLQSANFSSSWSLGSNAVLASGYASPDGGSNGTQYTVNGSSGYITQTVTFTASTAYTASLYIKPISGSTSSFDLVVGKTDSTDGAVLQVSVSGTSLTYVTSGARPSGTFIGYSIQSFANGWYRISITGTTAGTSGGMVISAPNSGQVVLIWGAQVEQNSFATSYVPTTSTTATRAADSLTNTSISGWYNATQGTMFVEYIAFATPFGGRYPTAAQISDQSNNNRVEAQFDAATAGSNITISASAVQKTSNSVVLSSNTVIKQGAIYGSGLGMGAYNGNIYSGGTLSAAGVPANVNTLYLGAEYAGSITILNGWLRSFAYYNTALSSAQLQTISGQL